MPRKNKSKKDIVSDIQLVQDAERRRNLVSGILFPFLIEMKESIGYSKIFLQSFSGLIEGVFDAQRKTITISQIKEDILKKLKEVFDIKDEKQKIEHDRYAKLVEILEDISIQDLSYATELARYIDGYILQKRNKDSIETISISEILG